MSLNIEMPVPVLQNRITLLEEENRSLKQKLSNKQDQINRTNAYWKGKVHKLQKRPVSKHAIAI